MSRFAAEGTIRQYLVRRMAGAACERYAGTTTRHRVWPDLRGNSGSVRRLLRDLRCPKQGSTARDFRSDPAHSNAGDNTWRAGHIQVILLARQGNANQGWGANAAADHFLTDAFSGGHIRTPRATLMGSAMGNIESKIPHDLGNEHGVELSNRRGDTPWIAFGDDMLSDPRNIRNRQLAVEAVDSPGRDIADALAQRTAYPAPTPATAFPAELLVPRPMDPNRDRSTGRTPTYVPGPSGGAIRAADDYTVTRDRIIANEAPGIVAGFFNDDNQIRDWVSRNGLAAIARQPGAEKIRMVNNLMNGWIDYEDVSTIERICQSVTTGAEMAEIRNAIRPRTGEAQNIGQRTRTRIALERIP